MGDTTGFRLAPDCSTLTQVNSFSRRFRQAATVTALKLDDMRAHYDRDKLRQEDLCTNPFEQFAAWVKAACESDIVEPNAMSPATVRANGRPTQRTVLLKGFDEHEFVFHTNLESRKAWQISGNAIVSLLFPWLAVNGVAERVPRAIEFWQGRGHRLHDCFLYTRLEDGSWKIERLAP